MNNIAHFRKYCTLCGNCLVVCPANALEIKNNQVLVNSNCTNCGNCLKNCSGYEFDYKHFNKELFNNLKTTQSNYIGHYQSLKIGKSRDSDVLKKASSGGVVTTILIKALEKKQIHGAVMVSLSKDLKPLIKIARSKKEILEGTGSKYLISSPNKILKEFKKKEKYAFVGLPCQIHGIRLLQKNKNPQANQIKFCIGIFCGRTMYPEATDFILKKLKCSKTDVRDLNYRGGKWPKGFLVKTKYGEEHFLHKHYYDLFNLMFNPERCLVCPDYTNEFGDISVGDCWLKNKEGYSTIVIRTDKGKNLYNLIKDEILTESVLDSIEIIKTHPNFKYKQGALLRGKWLKLFPKYNLGLPSCNLIKTKVFYFIIKTLMTNTSKKFVKFVPLKLIGLLVHLRRWLA